jgi:uncharacterized protein
MNQLTRTTPFNYVCHACKRCCHMYQVRVNPYDVLVLARHLRMSTTDVGQRYLNGNSSLLRRNDGACVFLGQEGCSVHSARPLACRLYPLGREVSSNGEEHFFRLDPHPLTAGVYGNAGTVEDFLAEQDTRGHVEAADRYLQLFRRSVQALGSAPNLGHAESAVAAGLLDADSMIKNHRADVDTASLDAAGSMSLHIEAIDSLLTRITDNHDGES